MTDYADALGRVRTYAADIKTGWKTVGADALTAAIVKQHGEDLEALLSVVEQQAKALEPFAKQAARFLDSRPDDDRPTFGYSYRATVGDFRSARSAYELTRPK
jgi:hypothetical protein